jgi:hypothetical protein
VPQRLRRECRNTPSGMLDELDNLFDDHPSLDASLEDFESNTHLHRSPMFNMPSQHSGFRSEDSDGEDAEIEDPSQERWSPPGFHQPESVEGSGWYRHQPYLRKGNPHTDRLQLVPTIGLGVSPSQSREPSPQYEDALESPAKSRPSDRATPGDISVAANVPLPAGADTPLHGRSPSPAPRPSAGRTPRDSSEDDGDGFGPDIFSNCRRCLTWNFSFSCGIY